MLKQRFFLTVSCMLLIFPYRTDILAQFTPLTIAGGELLPKQFSSVYAIDVDSDGDMDVVSASIHDDKIAWYENDGDEHFTMHTIATDADHAISVYAVDMDGDGDIDVLSASFLDNKIAWYENDGNENFTTHIITATATYAHAVYAADVDSDGDMDVLSASQGDDKIAWYENDGDENFTAHTISYKFWSAYCSVYAINVDSDGDMDVLSTSWGNNTVAWHENDGDQNFTFHYIDSDLYLAESVYATDIDSDGDIDVLSAGPRGFKWYENDGDEDFTFHTIMDTSTAYGYSSVYAEDLDGDGDMDMLCSCENLLDDKVFWYENDGENHFTTHTLTYSAAGAVSVYAEDVNGDGHMDVLSASHMDNKIVWYENDGNKHFNEHPIVYDVFGAESVYSTDVDGDGDMDVLSVAFKKISWYENEGNTCFTAHTITSDLGTAKSVYAVDMDGDDDVDVLSASGYSIFAMKDRIAWHENDGNERFTTHIITTDMKAGNSVYAEDMDGDGDMDVLSACGTRYSASTGSYDGQIHWYENDGNEQFTTHAIATDLESAKSVYAADLDGDGDMDVLSASTSFLSGYGYITWYENDGNEQFSTHTISDNAYNANSVYAEDMDGDGDMDVLSACGNEYLIYDQIAWYENDGEEQFTTHIITTDLDYAHSVYAADLNKDGHMDVLSASAKDDKIAWYENDGNKQFTTHVITTDADSARSVYAVDLDGDGDMDVLSASYRDNKIAWYRNDMPIVVSPVAHFGADPVTGTRPLTVQFSDSSTGSINTWSWDFGDGNTSTEQNPQHTYEIADTFTVSLTVTGPGGSDTETRIDYISVYEQVPVCDFGADTTFGTLPLEVQFSDSSTGIITAWTWDLGDGNTSTVQNPQHTYETADTFTVSLTVTGPGGSDSETKEDYIIVISASSVENLNNKIPENFTLYQNYPNPFNPSTHIKYCVKYPCKVSLIIYNTKGQMIQTMVDSYQQPGIHDVEYDCTNLSSGIYFYKIQMGDFQDIKKMLKIN